MSLDDILSRLNELEASTKSFADTERKPPEAPPTAMARTDSRAPREPALPETPDKSSLPVPPPSVPKQPEDAGDTRYGRSGANLSRWPNRNQDAPSIPSTGVHIDARPDPVDISIAAEDDYKVEPAMKQTKQVDLRTIMLAALYLALILFAVAAAIYI